MAVAAVSRGHIDFYGHDPGAAGYILCGWASHALVDQVRSGRLTLVFDSGDLTGTASGATYPRPALGELGIGVLIFVAADQPAPGRLRAVMLGDETNGILITPSKDAKAADGEALRDMLAPILPGISRTLPREVLRRLAPELIQARGAIDLAGWADDVFVLSGWAPVGREGELQVEATCALAGRSWTAPATIVLQERDGLEGRGVGVVMLMPRDPSMASDAVLSSVSFALDGETVALLPTPAMIMLDGARLRGAVRPMLARLDRGHVHDRLTRLAAPRGYRGGSTLDGLTEFVRIEIDEAMRCPPGGLILVGWMLAHPATVESIVLHSGPNTTLLRGEHWLSIPRGGVVEAIGQEHGLVDSRCGFIALFPEGHNSEAASYLEVRTRRGEVAYRDVPAPRLSGLQAIQRLLGEIDVQFADLAPAFDSVLGPAITRLNRARLALPAIATTIRFGPPITGPRCSVIVPLYRRLDYMDFQVGLLAADPPGGSVELIYVLDDPPLRREAENLAALLYARHGVAITLICLDRNQGFAPASNAGLREARGEFVCLLNSDVFPQGPGWLDRLCDRLEATPSLGVVGPMLLYEDGSVQHRGMSFRQLPQFGDWFFGDHPGKGLKPESGGGLETCISVTGACMVLRRDLAQRLGGFDEGFVIGDFEDSDLCLRIQDLGLGCAVDLDERLYHLERKSQASSAQRWRMNLTIFNAWFHQQRWGARLSQSKAPA